jgi:hypothetical protein
MKKLAGILISLLLPIASTNAQELPGEASTFIAPFEAIKLAADDPVNGVVGVFEFEVRGSGRDKKFVYLNSEMDYRDQRCLTVRMTRGNAAALEKRLGLSPREELIGKRIRVHGTARRQQIVITNSGRRTGLYYYQTHIYVDDPDQIELLGGGA